MFMLLSKFWLNWLQKFPAFVKMGPLIIEDDRTNFLLSVNTIKMNNRTNKLGQSATPGQGAFASKLWFKVVKVPYIRHTPA